MSDSYLFVTHKDEFDNTEISEIGFDRAVYKKFMCAYDSENPINSHYRRFPSLVWHEKHASDALVDIINFWNSDKSGFQWEYQEKGELFYDYIKDKNITKVEFTIL